jgi:PEP-CTERM motif
MMWSALATFFLLLSSASSWAVPIELLTNGGFESGSFLGWTVTDLPGSGGSFFVDDADGATPLTGLPTIGPAAGSFYAVSDQLDSGTHVLLQPFTVPSGATSVTLSFDLFVTDWSFGAVVNPGGLDHNLEPNQHARVDILAPGADPFATSGGVLSNFYLGVDPFAMPNPFTPYVFDITGLVVGGGDYVLRFAEVDNQFFLNMGVDNASIVADVTQPVATPEPASLALVALGLLAAFRYRR